MADLDTRGERSRPPVKAIIFDWGGTLTLWHAIDLVDAWNR